MERTLWNITMLNTKCPFVGSVKKTGDEFYHCAHELNLDGGCCKDRCPIETVDFCEQCTHDFELPQ